MSEDTTTITRDRAITLINDSIENFATYYDSYCCDNRDSLSDEERELYQEMSEVTYILRNDADYANDLKIMPLEHLTQFLYMCKEMVENNDLFTKYSYPKGNILIVENEHSNPELIEKALESLEQHGDERIKNAIKEYHAGDRQIRFSKMPENQNGLTYRINDKYSHFVTENLMQDTPENQIQVAITLAHEFKRNAATDSIEGETREIVLEDTKIIESFANTYGEEIYQKFPEYGILHYIKKIFGETELQDFADFAFDSTGNYWKVNSAGDLIDDGMDKQVLDSKNNIIYKAESGGKQTTLQKWLENDKQFPTINAFATLMQPAGYDGYKSSTYEWEKNPGIIEHSIIETAHNKGQLTDDQYNMIQLAAGLLSNDNNQKNEESTFIKTLKEEYGPKIKNNLAKVALIWTELRNRKKVKQTEAVVNVVNNTEKKNHTSQKSSYYKRPKNFQINFTPDIMKEFEKVGNTTNCNLFLNKLTGTLDENIAKKILPNGVKSAMQMYKDWQTNENLECINPQGHFDKNRNASQKAKDAELAGNKANEFANQGYLVLAASPDFDYVTTSGTKHYTAHVSIVITQDTKYNYDAVGDDQTCFLGSNGYTGHQGRKEPEVLRDYPVFLQAGNSTGIVPPGWAFSRGLFLNDKVDYYVVKN